MMSAPRRDWIAAVMRAWRSLALIVSSVTSIFICLLYSAIRRLSSASPSGMKSTHCRRWSFAGWAKAGAPPPPAARSASGLDGLRKPRREIVVMSRLLASFGDRSDGRRVQRISAVRPALSSRFRVSSTHGPRPGEGAHGITDWVGAPRAIARLAGHGHALLPHGGGDARDRKRLHQARGPGHRHTPRAGGGDDGPRVQPRDPAPRRLDGLLGTGDDQPRDGRRQRLRRRRPADRGGRVEPARLSRDGGVPGDRSGRDHAPDHEVGRARARGPAHPRARGHRLPGGDVGPAGPRLSRPPGRRPGRGRGRGECRVPGPLRAYAPAAGRPGGDRGRRRPPRCPARLSVVHVDVTPRQRGATRRVDGPIAGDARAVLEQLVAEARGKLDRGRYAAWGSRLRALHAEKAAEMDKQMSTDQVPIHPLRLCKEVRDFLRRDAILVVDGQEILTYGRQSIPTFAPGHRLNSGPFGRMGVGLPFGVGAKVARPDAQVLVLHGDGSYGLNAMEIDTAVRHRIPVVVVISNNGGWTADPQGSKPGRNLGYTRYDKVAQDLGAHGEFVEKP